MRSGIGVASVPVTSVKMKTEDVLSKLKHYLKTKQYSAWFVLDRSVVDEVLSSLKKSRWTSEITSTNEPDKVSVTFRYVQDMYDYDEG